jgi:hypothetical protein
MKPFRLAFGDPPVEFATPETFDTLAKAGFDAVFLGVLGKASEQALVAAASAGVGCVVADEKIGQLINKGSTHAERVAAARAFVERWQDDERVVAYWITDEPAGRPEVIEGLADFHDLFRELAPDRLAFCNLYPSYAELLGLLGTSDFAEYVGWIAAACHPRFMTYDFYPLMADGTELPRYLEDFAVFQEAGREHQFEWGICVQTTDYWPNGHPEDGRRRPNANEVMWQVNLALAHGARSIIPFTYWTPSIAGIEEFGAAIIGRDGAKTDLYLATTRANAWFAEAANATEGLLAEPPNLLSAGERREFGDDTLTVTQGNVYITSYLGLDGPIGGIGIFNASHSAPAAVGVGGFAGARMVSSANGDHPGPPAGELRLPPAAGAMVALPR